MKDNNINQNQDSDEITEVLVEEIIIDNVKYLIDDDNIVYKEDVMNCSEVSQDMYVGLYNREKKEWFYTF